MFASAGTVLRFGRNDLKKEEKTWSGPRKNMSFQGHLIMRHKCVVIKIERYYMYLSEYISSFNII